MDLLRGLDVRQRERLKSHLLMLEDDPLRPRSKVDIKNCGRHHGITFYRLRVGDWRAVYVVEGETVKVTEIIRRGRGYRWLE